MNTNDGGPAFPFNEKDGSGVHYHSHGGMTLRDYFAAKALPALIREYNSRTETPMTIPMIVELAWRTADEMLVARNKL